MNAREELVESVKIAILQADPQNTQTIAEAAVGAVLKYPLDVLHYAKDEKPTPRIKEKISLVNRTDGWRERVQGSHNLGDELNDSLNTKWSK